MKAQKEISDYFLILLYFAKYGGLRKPVTITTSDLGIHLGVSQQTISRKLIKMEEENLIVRQYTQIGNSIVLTAKSRSILEGIFTELWVILTSDGFKSQETLTLKGKVVTGMGEGAYYMELAGYRTQFETILGFTPFLGTLNLQLIDNHYLSNFDKLIKIPTIFANGFVHEGRKFGKVFIWFVYLIIKGEKIPSAIIRPDRTHHSSQIELITKENIKATYNIKDGDELEVELRDSKI